MNLFPNEEILVRSNNEQLILTSHRLQLKSKDWGATYSNTIFLEDIGSIEVKYTSLLLLLIIGIVLILGGIFGTQEREMQFFNMATIAGFVAIVIYFVSRRHVVSITPMGGRALSFQVNSMGQEEITDFIDKLQLAKLARLI